MNLKLRKILWYFSVTLNIYLLWVKIIQNLKVAPKVWSYVVNCKWPHSQKNNLLIKMRLNPLPSSIFLLESSQSSSIATFTSKLWSYPSLTQHWFSLVHQFLVAEKPCQLQSSWKLTSAMTLSASLRDFRSTFRSFLKSLLYFSAMELTFFNFSTSYFKSLII